MNPDGIWNGNGYFAFGEEAGIGVGNSDCGHNGTAKVIRIDKTRVLCEYGTENKAYGTECPNGAIFFISKAEFVRQLANHEKQVREERIRALRKKTRLTKEKERVIQLLTK